MPLVVTLIDAIGPFLNPLRPEDEQVVLPYGLLTLASCVREAFGQAVEVDVVNTAVEGRDRASLAAILEKRHPDVVGVRGLQPYADRYFEAVVVARNAGAALVLGGGPLATTSPEAALVEGVDFVVIGEGERTLVELLERYLAGRTLREVDGLAWREGGGVQRSRPRAWLEDLDRVPYPAYDLLDQEVYRKRLSYGYNHRRQGVLFTSRGCPYGCTFCVRLFGSRFRAQSPGRVVDELAWLVETQAITDFSIVDDTFNLDRSRVLAICAELARRGLAGRIRLYLVNGLRADLVDEEVLDALVTAGTVWVAFALETVVPRLQQVLGKQLDVGKAIAAIEAAAERGMVVAYWGLVGIPGETLAEVDATLEALLTLPPAAIPMLFHLKPFPGTAFTAVWTEHDFEESRYHDFLPLLRASPDYLPLLERWWRGIHGEDRLSAVVRALWANHYTEEDIRSLFRAVYRAVAPARVEALLARCRQ